MAEAKAKKDGIRVAPPKIMAITFEIEGMAPGYLGNAYSEEAMGNLPPNNRPPQKKSRQDPDFDAIASGIRRMLKPAREGATDGFPASALKQSIVRAGMSLTELKGTDMQVQFFVVGGRDGLIPLRGADPETFSRTGNLGGKKGSGCIITQPLYAAPWYATVRIEYDETHLSDADMISLVQLAGGSVGIGAWRPEKKGEFGRFRINDQGGVRQEMVM